MELWKNSNNMSQLTMEKTPTPCSLIFSSYKDNFEIYNV